LAAGLAPLNSPLFNFIPEYFFFVIKTLINNFIIYMDFRSAFPRYRYESINALRLENFFTFNL